MNLNNNTLLTQLKTSKWLILPAYHEDLLKRATTLESNTIDLQKLAGVPKYISVETPEGESGLISHITVNGPLTKQPSPLEQELLGVCDIDQISNALDESAGNPAFKYILLDFNSPGGNTLGIAELGRKIVDIDTNIKPVYVWTETMMASAAYWLGSQGRKVGMLGSSQVGAVGVYTILLNNKAKYAMEGTEVIPFYSGKYKMMGHDFRAPTDEEKQIIDEDVKEQHSQFKNVIQARRPQIKSEDLEGLVLEGEKALAKGFVDYVGDSLNDYIAWIESNNLTI